MDDPTITAIAHPNIAFIKYWGNCDPDTRVPANGSISMNLAGLDSRTTVTFDESLTEDELMLQGNPAPGAALARVGRFLDVVRRMAGIDVYASVVSENNFPMGVGIASSASAFAALALASSRAAGLELSEIELSRLARLGSGSACRSVPGGFVEWQVAGCEDVSAAVSIASPDHWGLVDNVAIVDREHKRVGSTEGHTMAHTSPLQRARVDDAPRRLDICRSALLERDFEALAGIVELDSNMMHAVILSSDPPVMYWNPATLAIMREVSALRGEGHPVCYTIDAGPNVHVIVLAESSDAVQARLHQIPGVLEVITARPGGPAHLIPTP